MKTKLLKIAFLVFLFSFKFGASNCFAAESDLNSAFTNYQKSYQTGDYEAAKTTIEEALKSHTHNSYLIYNLGLAEYKLGKAGLALGHWRKALAINPQFNEARAAINYATSQMQPRPLTKTTDSTWVWLEKLVLDYLSFNILWPFFLLCLLFLGYDLIKYLGAKKRAFENDEATPVLGARPLVFFALTICLGFVSVVSFIDMNSTKATVIAKPTEIKTGPNADFGTLFEIPEGTEVLIRDKDSDWYKIEDPTGRAGWVLGSQLFVTNN